MTRQEVTDLYVAESLRLLPEYLDKSKLSLVRIFAETQGKALATVLERVQATGGISDE